MILRTPALALLAAAALYPQSARASDEDDACTSVDAPIATFFFVDGCTSPVGLCTRGSIASGPLQGTTRFEVLTLGPGPIPNTLVYTGALTITTPTGTVNIRDRGVLDENTGQFFEFDRIVGGTGAFEHASGLLTSQGLALPQGFSGTIAGAVCVGEDDAEGEEDRAED